MQSKAKVLLAEDDTSLAFVIKDNLEEEGYDVTWCADGEAALQQFLKNVFDICLLDVMMPVKDGFTLAKKIRQKSDIVPILFITAKSLEQDKLDGFKTGADDYLTKPFSVREFIARVKAIIRRTEMANNSKDNSEKIITCDQLTIDPQKRKVLLNENKIDLTPKEFDLLYLFMCNPGKSYSRENLLRLVWGYEFSGYEHTVNSHINRLRSKIESDLASPKYILTTWGVGYRFTDELKLS